MRVGNLGAASDVAASISVGFVANLARDPRTRAWLRQRGYEIAKRAIKSITGRTSPPTAVERALEPLLEPIEQGVVDAITEYATPYLTKASLIMAGGGVFLGWLIGRARRRGYAEGAASRQLPKGPA